jgi:hypothetical protein
LHSGLGFWHQLGIYDPLTIMAGNRSGFLISPVCCEIFLLFTARLKPVKDC